MGFISAHMHFYYTCDLAGYHGSFSVYFIAVLCMTELSDSQVPDTQPWNRISKGYPSTAQVMDFTFTEGHAVGSKFTYNV